MRLKRLFGLLVVLGLFSVGMVSAQDATWLPPNPDWTYTFDFDENDYCFNLIAGEWGFQDYVGGNALLFSEFNVDTQSYNLQANLGLPIEVYPSYAYATFDMIAPTPPNDAALSGSWYAFGIQDVVTSVMLSGDAWGITGRQTFAGQHGNSINLSFRVAADPLTLPADARPALRTLTIGGTGANPFESFDPRCFDGATITPTYTPSGSPTPSRTPTPTTPTATATATDTATPTATAIPTDTPTATATSSYCPSGTLVTVDFDNNDVGWNFTQYNNPGGYNARGSYSVIADGVTGNALRLSAESGGNGWYYMTSGFELDFGTSAIVTRLTFDWRKHLTGSSGTPSKVYLTNGAVYSTSGVWSGFESGKSNDVWYTRDITSMYFGGATVGQQWSTIFSSAWSVDIDNIRMCLVDALPPTATTTASATPTATISNTPSITPTSSRTPNPNATPSFTPLPNGTQPATSKPQPPTATRYPIQQYTLPPLGTLPPPNTSVPSGTPTVIYVPTGIPSDAQGIGGMGGAIIAAGSNAMSQAFKYADTLYTTVSSTLTAWKDTPPTPINGLPRCATNPLGSQLCAIYYVMANTILSGTLGGLIIPLATAVLNSWLLLTFIKLARAILARTAKVVEV